MPPSQTSQHAQTLLRKKPNETLYTRSTAFTGKVKTIPDEAAVNTRLEGKDQGEDLARLTSEVAAMPQVFDDANKARDEQRKIMDDLHQDLLRRISGVREYMGQVGR